MPKLYSLEESIIEFFEDNTTVTKEECDSIAKSLIGNPVFPMPIQGAWSYTVHTGEETVSTGEDRKKIVQFRAHASTLDMSMLALARQIHPEFVPKIEFHGQTGGLKPLYIYVAEKVPGVPRVIANSAKKASKLGLNTVVDFSRFFAQAWTSSQSLPSAKSADMEIKLQQKLDILIAQLPARFTRILSLLRKKYLPLLFREGYPIVLTHGDLCMLNVLVDPESLCITGFVDWADAVLAPFGLALYGIFNVLGFMDSEGWHYYPDHQDMVTQFWTTFEHEIGPLSDAKKDVIRAACAIGIFMEDGFTWNGQDKTSPAEEGDASMKYLDGWLGSRSSTNDLLLSSTLIDTT